MKIALESAFFMLEDCSAISLEDSELMYPALSDLTGSDENEFMYLQWTDSKGLTYSTKFEEGFNLEVEVSKNIMTLIDSEGYEMSLYLLGPYDCEESAKKNLYG